MTAGPLVAEEGGGGAGEASEWEDRGREEQLVVRNEWKFVDRSETLEDGERAAIFYY